MEIKRFKPCDLSENSESDLVGVTAPSNASICVEACTSTKPTEPEVFETRKVLVTPFTPVQLSLLKLASTKVPKVCQKKSRERSVERKVVSDPPSLTVSICPKPKPAAASADRVPQLDGCLNREATATMNGEGKSNQVDRKAAGVSLSVPQQWSSFAPIRSTGQHWQHNRKRQASRKRNAAKRLNSSSCPSNSVNNSAVSYPARLYISAFQPLKASVPATNTSAKTGYLSRSQRKKRNRAMRRLNGISNTTGSSSVKIEDSVDLLSSLLQSTTLGFCTGSYESAKYCLLYTSPSPRD